MGSDLFSGSMVLELSETVGHRAGMGELFAGGVGGTLTHAGSKSQNTVYLLT